jgi:hypothetical protein
MQRWLTHALGTDPGSLRDRFAVVGPDLKAAVEGVQGLLIHGEAVEAYGLAPSRVSTERP